MSSPLRQSDAAGIEKRTEPPMTERTVPLNPAPVGDTPTGTITRTALATASPASQDYPADDGYKWKVLSVVIFGTFMSILDNTVVNVALRTLQDVFRADISRTQGVVTYYALALGIVIPVAGFLADRFGIKRVYVGSLIAFTLASMLCGLAPSLNALIAFRIIQGIGGGALLPLGTAMLYGAFPPNERGLALGFFGIPTLVAPALGPTLGGYLVEYANWRLIFYINVPLGIIGAIVAIRLLRERRSVVRARFDLPGAALSVVGFGSLLYGLSNAADNGWTSARVVTALGIGVVAVVTFFLVELRVRQPLLNVRLYGKPVYLLASMLGWVAAIAFFGVSFLLPLYLQTLRGRTPFQSGLLLLPQAAAAVISVAISGRLYDRIGPRWVITTGVTVLAISTIGFVRLSETTSFGTIIALLAVRGLALGCVFQPTQATALSVVERDQLTRASSLTNVMRNVFQSLGVAVLGTILQTAGRAPVVSGRSLDAVAYTINGYHAAYSVALVFSIVGIGLAVFLPSTLRRGKRGVAGESATITPPADVVPVEI